MRYLIVTIRPFALSPSGYPCVEEGWALDLENQLRVFPSIYVMAPRIPYDHNMDYHEVRLDGISFFPFPGRERSMWIVLDILATFHALRREVKRGDIVHCVCGIGSRFPPYGVFALFYCGHLGNHKRTVLVLDGDEVADLDFMIGRERSSKKRITLRVKKLITKSMLNTCVSKSPLTLVVGDALYKRYHNRGCVKEFHASWVKESEIISDVDVANKIRQSDNDKGLRIIFAGRLMEKKGPQVAVEVARLLDQMGVPFELDIYGQGPLLTELNSSINRWRLLDRVKLKGVLGYNDFCKALRRYDAILIPSLSGEQPRIIFDAMANGVCVVASNLPAFVDIIEDKRNGLLCDPQFPISFAQALEELHLNRNMLRELILNGILTVKSSTIESMHQIRKSIIEAELSE